MQYPFSREAIATNGNPVAVVVRGEARLAAIARWAGFTVLAVITALTCVPPGLRIVTRASHATEHFVIFFVAGVLFAVGYQRRLAIVAVAMAGTGVLELLQLLVPGRHARLSDFVINVAGAYAGMALAWLCWRFKDEPGAGPSR